MNKLKIFVLKNEKEIKKEEINSPFIEITNLKDSALQQHEGWSLFIHEGDSLSTEFIERLEKFIQFSPETLKAIYFDHKESLDFHNLDYIKPAFNYDLLTSNPYMGRAVAFRNCYAKTIIDDSLSVSSYYKAVLNILKIFGPDSIAHLPIQGCTLTGEHASVFSRTTESWVESYQALAGFFPDGEIESIQEGPAPGTFHVIYPLKITPLVSIIIPTKDQIHLLSRCIETLLEKTNYQNFEIIVVDNDSQTLEAKNYLSGLIALDTDKISVISCPGAFNFSHMNNIAVRASKGDYIVMLNNDTAVTDGDWLEHMMRHALRDKVGVVGARLLYPDGKLQHAGVIMGLRGPAEHPCLGLDGDDPGYLFRTQLTQNFSAVTAACLLVSKEIYEEVGGLDEEVFGVSYNDIDFCLRVGKTGRLIVWTPLATLLHEGSASQKAAVEQLAQPQKSQRFLQEQNAMYKRWPEVIANDPAYNPTLSLAERGYEVETNPLLSFSFTEKENAPRIAAFAADVEGCGNYRIIQPMLAMLEVKIATGGLSPEIFTPNLALRSGAETFIFQRPNSEVMLHNLKSLASLKGIKKIYEIDDNISQVPLKSAHYNHIPRDFRGKILKAISLCDRLVVSTEPLAHALNKHNGDVRVVPNRLPPAMWGATPPVRSSLEKRREKHKKPRIGWAGGISHQGDLEMIASVIKDLSDQVDWVFMGMCPEIIRPYVKEFHLGVPINEYTKKLMDLSNDWDLAIAPVEVNPFNECKSNLKLLEYGWCGVPTICSDFTPYQGTLKTSLVRNRHKDWINTIKEKISDLQACHNEGLALQTSIHENWMLNGSNLQSWREAWTD